MDKQQGIGGDLRTALFNLAAPTGFTVLFGALGIGIAGRGPGRVLGMIGIGLGIVWWVCFGIWACGRWI
jgi:hypothetical protein